MKVKCNMCSDLIDTKKRGSVALTVIPRGQTLRTARETIYFGSQGCLLDFMRNYVISNILSELDKAMQSGTTFSGPFDTIIEDEGEYRA